MLDWTDRHCRYFHRLLAPDAVLYTEMVTTGALIHGDRERHLAYNPEEHPLALQLGGSEPADLARCAKMAEDAGYDEVNLNVGCPSDRVQKGKFGACLMLEPALVRDGIAAMRDAVGIDVTVKSRLGVDEHDSYAFFSDFIGTVSESGCRTFIIHARKAWLSGLSPKQNRDVPPLHYDRALRLKGEHPELEIVLNGGITSVEAAKQHLAEFDGVMLGRAAYQSPWILAELQCELFGRPGAPVHNPRHDQCPQDRAETLETPCPTNPASSPFLAVRALSQANPTTSAPACSVASSPRPAGPSATAVMAARWKPPPGAPPSSTATPSASRAAPSAAPAAPTS